LLLMVATCLAILWLAAASLPFLSLFASFIPLCVLASVCARV
jgi:hypothetical protein